MKTLLALTAYFISVNASAFTQKANLDFTNLYGKTNAGHYEMAIELLPKTSISESTLSFKTVHDDGEQYCVSSASFEIGTMNFSLVDRKTGWKTEIKKTISASISYKSNDETCETDIAQFSGNKDIYAVLGLNQSITLPVKAPFDYETVGVYLSPFNGHLYLPAVLTVKNGLLNLNPSSLLTAQTIVPANTSNSAVTYYVYAQKNSTSLSLGNGVIKF